jgi:hypothetical protein
MHLRVANWIRGAAVASAIAGLVVAGPLAAEPRDEELPPIERLQKGLVGIRSHLQNMSIKVRYGMGGVSSDESAENEATGKPPTPAESCCASNLERINEKIHGMTRTLEQLDIYFAERGNSEGLAVVDEIRVELNVVARGVAVLKMAGTAERADQAQIGILRPYNRLRKAVERLETCCPVEAVAPAGRGRKRRP